jgi:hypothetical protein
LRPTIYKCIDKALAAGVEAGLRDRYHRPYPSQIGDEAKARVIDLACRKHFQGNDGLLGQPPGPLRVRAYPHKKHDSWLNLVESAFSKMARSFLRHIRVASLDELKHHMPPGHRRDERSSGSLLMENFQCANDLIGSVLMKRCATIQLVARSK